MNVQSGEVIGSLHQRHRAIEFLTFLETIDLNVPARLDVHLVLGIASSHKTPQISDGSISPPGSTSTFVVQQLIRLVERWFSELKTTLLRRGAHKIVGQLSAELRSWIDTWNDDPKAYVWVKIAEQILDSIRLYCERTNAGGH